MAFFVEYAPYGPRSHTLICFRIQLRFHGDEEPDSAVPGADPNETMLIQSMNLNILLLFLSKGHHMKKCILQTYKTLN